MEQVKVVAHFKTGELIKGYTNDFFPKKTSFHLGSNPTESGTEVAIGDLKALFFVKDFEGVSGHEKKLLFEEGKIYQGRKAAITFMDGEVIVGTVQSYDKDRPGFFIIPADEKDNNARIFAVASAVTEVKFL